MKLKGPLKHIFTVGSLTMVSRVLGFVREMLQSRLIGAGVEQSAFTLAFAIPNMSRKLFGEGALTAAFVPIFKESVEKDGMEEAAKLARRVFVMMMLMLFAAVMLGWMFLGGFAAFNYHEMSPRSGLIVSLLAVLLPYMLFICGAAFGMGVMNALGRFKASSFMPCLLNIIWIAALALLMFFPGIEIRYRIGFVSVAILFGGFAQMVFMFVCMHKAGIKILRRSALPWNNDKVCKVWRNTALGALGAGAVQINYMLDQVLGQLAAPWAAGVIGYAERLMDLPLGVVGVAFGTVLLPTFSGYFSKGDQAGARAALKKYTLLMLAVMVPAAFVTFFAAPLIVRLIYQGGAFDATATVRVARALSVYGIGLAFFGVQRCLVPFFQAQMDMKTPLNVTVTTVFVNAALNILAVWLLPVEWRHVGLAASTTFCAAVGCCLLLAKLRRKVS